MNAKLYVLLKEPNQFRRQLLEMRKQNILLLKKQESFRQARAERYREMERLQRAITGLHKELAQIRLSFPILRAKKAPVPMPKGKAAPKIPEKPKKVDEIARLETQLKDIENELSRLS